jgi:drug/metabolite transporter (DMT)-like permease
MIFAWKWTEFQHVTPHNWLMILLICTTTGGGAILLYYYGLRKINAMTSTILELFFPISAVVFDYFFNGKIFSPTQWIAALVMLFCIFMLNRKKRP